jgi:pimeloyl-ACP methyl ester carboxylesterase
MRRSIIGTTVGLLLCAAASAWAQKTNVNRPSGGFHRSVAARPAAMPQRTTAPIVINLNSGIIPALCPPDAASAGGTCGYLSVPLFRLDDDGSRINIYFEAYAHSNPGPAISAIVPNAGGPGGTTTGGRGSWLGVFASNLDAHDLLLVDNRGTGQSATIDCAAFQHGLGPTYTDEVAQCAAHLSPSNSQWGSGDVALDLDEVRKALGYNLIDYYGGSWGGVDASAYATRFPQHVRSIILDSSDGPATMLPFTIAMTVHGVPREVVLDCQRSPTCGVDHPDPQNELDALIRTVRAQPIRGYAQDANGNVIDVTVDEAAVGAFTVIPNGPWQDTGELLAAGKALSEGDPLPLLRLGAEEPYRVLSDFGDPTFYSGGDQLAALCVDSDGNIPYSYRQPLPTRLLNYQQAVADLPADFFSPFSVPIGTRVDVDFTHACAYWEEATRHIPLVPMRASYPSVPVLALASDMDPGAIETVRANADLYPSSSLIVIPEAFHEPVLSNGCANAIATNFIETLLPGDTACTQVAAIIWPALGRFPKVAADARSATIDPSGHNEIGLAERRVVTVAVASIVDAVKRSTIGSGNGVGLRGGTFKTAFNPSGQVTTLVDCAFASDVSVDGTLVWNSGSDLSLTADVSVKAGGIARGTLHISGAFHAPGPVGNYSVNGYMGGKRVAVVIPES